MGYRPMENKELGITTKYVGSKEFVDTSTGEVLTMEVIEKKTSHMLKGGWRRIYLADFMDILGELYGKRGKIRCIEWILDNLNSENQIIYTQTQISKKSGVALCVVNETMKLLLKKDFMKKIGSVYIVNPKFICSFGSDKKNMMIAVKYREES